MDRYANGYSRACDRGIAGKRGLPPEDSFDFCPEREAAYQSSHCHLSRSEVLHSRYALTPAPSVHLPYCISCRLASVCGPILSAVVLHAEIKPRLIRPLRSGDTWPVVLYIKSADFIEPFPGGVLAPERQAGL